MGAIQEQLMEACITIWGDPNRDPYTEAPELHDYAGIFDPVPCNE